MTSGLTARCGVLFLTASGILFAQQPTFAPGVNYPVGIDPESVVIGDLNGDGIPDLAVTNSNSNTISIYLGKGDGTFAAAAPAPVNSPVFVAIADMNADGKLDLVVSSGVYKYISVLFGNGDGTFAAPVTLSAGENANGIAVGDLNGDGTPDIAVANAVFGGGYLTVLFNNGDGTFQRPVHLGAGYDPFLLKIADLNGDGKADLLVEDQGLWQPGHNGSVAVLLGHGDGTFDAAKFYPAGMLLEGFAVGDFNGDGKQDLVVADLYTASYAVLTGNGDGTFNSPQFLMNGGFTATDVAAGDLNGDGKPEIVGVDFDKLNVTVFLNTTP